jgi:hypothetical protein
MTKWLALFVSIFMVGCVSPPPIPTFQKISLQPISVEHKAAISHVAKAKEIVKTLTITLPADKEKIDALSQELDQTQDALQRAEGLVTAKQQEADKQTSLANQEAQAHAKAEVEIGTLKISRHRYVKLLLWSALLNVAAIGWITMPIWKKALIP